MTHTFLVLGSNLGDRQTNLSRAINELSRHMKIKKISKTIESQPLLGMRQPYYLNLALEVIEDYRPYDLLFLLKEIERKVGRMPAARWAARIIDIDIIFKQKIQLCSADLTIPHKDFKNRPFVLEVISDIAPDYTPLSCSKTISELLNDICMSEEV